MATMKKKASRYEANRPWRKLYDTARWKRLRLHRLQLEPLCRYCKKLGRVTEANICDHIRPHKGDKDLFYDYANTQSLCKRCHDMHKQREEMGSLKREEFGMDGYPLDFDC
jgi:5-methylcytosine-specific restriction enzyme A